MFQSIRSFLNAPVFAEEEKTLLAKHLTSIAHILLVSTTLFVIFASILSPILLPHMVLVIPWYIIIFGIYFLIHRRLLKAASLLMVAGLWIVLTFSAAVSGGTSAPAFAGNVIVILTAALLLDQKSAIIFAGLGIVSGLSMMYGQEANLLPMPSPELNTPESFWVAQAIYFLVAIMLVRMSTEKVERALHYAQKELSERKRVEDELQGQRDFAVQVMDTLGQGVTVTNADRHYEYVNQAYARMLELSPPEIIGKTPKDFVIEDEIEEIDKAHERRMQGEVSSYPTQLHRASGEIVHALVTASPRWQDGKISGSIAVITDLSEQKKLEAEQSQLLSKMERRAIQLQTVAEVSRAISSILDLDLLLRRVVELICQHFNFYYVGLFLVDGQKRKAVLHAATGNMGEKMLRAHHSLEINHSSMIGWCISNKKARIALDVGKDAVRFNNPLLPLTHSEIALPLISRGEVIGGVSIQSEKEAAFSEEDITTLQAMADHVANAIDNARLFTERSELINELGSRNAELERFTYTVSHDLRSPLITMRGFLGFLEQDALSGNSERLKKDIQRIITATEKMQQLLNELLKLSRVGRALNPSEEISFMTIAQEAIELVRGRLDANAIKVEIDENLPKIFGDRSRLVEVVQNLIDNAAKFMGDQQNRIIQIGTSGKEADGKSILFVRDNGIGIAPQFQEQVFGLFNKLDPQSEGTGVGLALVKRIIEFHGGRIWIESDGKNGTIFYFTLPSTQGTGQSASS
ncbi:MAG: ATP-binding protein [Anaerolineales bacterium]